MGFTLGAIDCYSSDIINIFYTEGAYKLFVTDRLGILFTAQFSDQRSAGDNLLKGLRFRVRYANVRQYEEPKNSASNFRVIVNYDFPLL